MLQGVRGGAAVDRAALAGADRQGLAKLVTDFPEIAELDLNPVFATAQGAIAADVRIVARLCAAAGRYRPSRATRSCAR